MSASSRHDPVAATSGEPMTSTKFRVGIIGAGRVGTVLGAALARCGHRVVFASPFSAASQARIDRLLPGAPTVPVDHVADAVDILLIAVPDDRLAGLVRGLAESRAVRPGQVVIHTSGAHGIGALAPVESLGAYPMALHPAMTFTGMPGDLERLKDGVSFGVTTPMALRPLATRLVADLGGAVEWIPEEFRPLYHAALAHGANHLVTLVNEAVDRLRDAGVGDPQRVLGPLLRAALDNALRHGDAALTGPIARGDAGTVARHIATLSAVAPDSVPVYVALARRTADRAIASGRLRPWDAEPLLGVLPAGSSQATVSSPSAGASQSTSQPAVRQSTITSQSNLSSQSAA